MPALHRFAKWFCIRGRLSYFAKDQEEKGALCKEEGIGERAQVSESKKFDPTRNIQNHAGHGSSVIRS